MSMVPGSLPSEGMVIVIGAVIEDVPVYGRWIETLSLADASDVDAGVVSLPA